MSASRSPANRVDFEQDTIGGVGRGELLKSSAGNEKPGFWPAPAVRLTAESETGWSHSETGFLAGHPRLRFVCLACLLASVLPAATADLAADDAAAEQPPAAQSDETPPKKLFAGKVVFLADALQRRGVDTYEETGRHIVLETESGELVPILADWRGRAFYQDAKLRDRRVELIGFHRRGLPYLNVIAVYTFDDQGRRMYTDYWCDICSIPMYEIQPCECCQGDVRLRFQPQDLPEYIVDEAGPVE